MLSRGNEAANRTNLVRRMSTELAAPLGHGAMSQWRPSGGGKLHVGPAFVSLQFALPASSRSGFAPADLPRSEVSNHEGGGASTSNLGNKVSGAVTGCKAVGARSGKSVTCMSSPLTKNISVFPKRKSALYSSPSRPARGALAIVTNVGAGMRWTLVVPKTNGACGGRRSRVVLTPRCWRQVGEKQFSPMRVAKKPGHPGEREGNR